MNEHTKQNYINLVEFLGNFMGNNCEVVFHLIDPKGSHIAAIINNHISGRSQNAPLTGLALEFMQQGVYKDHDYVANYKGVSKNNTTLKSATYFIKDEHGRLEGMLCFNVDVSSYLDVANILLGMAEVSGISSLKNSWTNKSVANEVVEYFTDSLKDIVYSVVPEETLSSDVNLKPEQKLEIVRELFQKGIFSLKGAVPQVAEVMRVSEPSIYRYLKIIEEENSKKTK